MNEERIERVRSFVRDVPDFPKPGIMFKDITPMLANPEAFVTCLDLMAEHFVQRRPEVIVGIESRGFIFGAALAARMTCSFVPVRKPGKLPWRADKVEYTLEYGTDAVEMHVDAIEKGARVLIVDDLIATGGTAWAAAELIKRQEGDIVGAAFVIELEFLNGRRQLEGLEVFSVLRY